MCELVLDLEHGKQVNGLPCFDSSICAATQTAGRLPFCKLCVLCALFVTVLIGVLRVH
jgi:hypothetical protein